jgi:hypothetical protein
MIDKPWHGYSLHPSANKGHTLSAEEKAVIPVFKRPENSTESSRITCFIHYLRYIFQMTSKNNLFFSVMNMEKFK